MRNEIVENAQITLVDLFPDSAWRWPFSFLSPAQFNPSLVNILKPINKPCGTSDTLDPVTIYRNFGSDQV